MVRRLLPAQDDLAEGPLPQHLDELKVLQSLEGTKRKTITFHSCGETVCRGMWPTPHESIIFYNAPLIVISLARLGKECTIRVRPRFFTMSGFFVNENEAEERRKEREL